MPDFVKLISKHRARDLHPGEEVVGAVFVQPTGTFGKTVAFGVAGALGSAIADAARKQDEAAASDSLAARVPGGRLVLAMSPMRLMVFTHSAMSGRPKELAVEYGWDQIAGIELGEGRVKQPLSVNFADESAAVFEVTKTAKPGPFMEAYARLRG
jgi:hypothetical protein